MIYFSSQPGRRYVEGYKKELYKRKMKISSWRLLEPSKRKLRFPNLKMERKRSGIPGRKQSCMPFLEIRRSVPM